MYSSVLGQNRKPHGVSLELRSCTLAGLWSAISACTCTRVVQLASSFLMIVSVILM